MRRYATPFGLLLALTVAAAPAFGQVAQSQLISTGTVQTTVYNNGNLGGDCGGVIIAFRFNSDEGLCGAGFLVGISSTNVVGDAYILNQNTGWTPVSIGASTDFPYPTLNQGVKAVFTNATNNLSVELNAYYSTADPDYVVYRYAITNTGTAERTVYPGMFADWDVGGAVYAQNLAAVNTTEDVVYVWDPTNTSTNYYGVASLTHDLVNWRHDTPYPSAAGQPHARADLWTGLTAAQGTTSAARDQRHVIGIGAQTIPAGGTFVTAFALVAGTNLADLIANTQSASAAANPPVVAIHDTGVSMLEVFGDGFIGTDLGVGVGFTFSGANGLFEGQLVVGTSATTVCGQPYASDPGTPPSDWAEVSAPAPITPPAGFNQAFQAQFNCTGATTPLGILVTQKTYSGAGDAYVIAEYTIMNTTASTLSNVHVGMFADWDVSATATADRAGYDATTRTLYTYNNTATGNQNYYGVAALNSSGGAGVSGYNVDVTSADASVFNALTTTQTIPTTQADRRNVIGVGPYTIPAGGSVTVRFAFVGGSNLATLLTNAALAQAEFPVANEPGSPSVSEVRLGPARPNPVSGTAALTFTLPEAQPVTLSVYDALGRRVATLVDGLASAGENPVVLDASALPNGVYLLRLTAGSTHVTRSISVVR